MLGKSLTLLCTPNFHGSNNTHPVYVYLPTCWAIVLMCTTSHNDPSKEHHRPPTPNCNGGKQHAMLLRNSIDPDLRFLLWGQGQPRLHPAEKSLSSEGHLHSKEMS